MPDSGSPYAAAGTLAHAIAELKSRKYFGIPEPMSTREFNKQLKKLKEDPGYDKGMDAATDLYLEHLKARAMSFGPIQPFVTLETRVDYSNLVPEGFGTADCIMIGAGRLEVVDYKNGAGVPVSAEANYQMMLYALGALNTFYFIYGDTIHTVHFSIVQPNAGGVKEWECQVEDLAEWGETVVRPAAELAWAGKGEFVPGDWCRFCKAKAQCSARAKVMLELGDVPHALEPADTAGPLLTDSQLGDALTRGRALAAWVSDMEKYALTAALEGRTIAGYKVVEGWGCWVFTASSKQAPFVVDAQVQPIIDPTQVYSGMWANVNVTFFAYSNAGKKGIGCGLNGVQKVRDDTPLASRVTAQEAFQAIPASPVAPTNPAPQAPAAPAAPAGYPAPAVDPITGQPLP